MSIVEAIGGWNNIFQGLGSAIISGFVAAFTAILVMRLGHRSALHVALVSEGRLAAHELLGSIPEFVLRYYELRDADDWDRWDKEASRWWALCVRLCAAIQAADPRSYNRRVAPAVKKALQELDLFPSNRFPDDSDAFEIAAFDLLKTLEAWLHGGKESQTLINSGQVE